MKRLAVVFSFCMLCLMSPAKTETMAIANARIATMDDAGVIEQGVIVIDDGFVTAVGPDVSPPAGAELIDAKGAWVTPGGFASMSAFGVIEVGGEARTVDDRVRDAGFHAAFDVSYGVNPAATQIATARREGVTRAAVRPAQGDGLFAGFGALIHLGEDRLITTHRRSFMMMAFGGDAVTNGGGARGGVAVKLKWMFDEAREYQHRPKTWEGPFAEPDMQAIGLVLQGDAPLIVRVSRSSDILELIRLLENYPSVRLVLYGAEEGWVVGDELAASKIPVIINADVNLPTNFNVLAATRENAQRLAAAGVLIAITPRSDVNSPWLLWKEAGMAVANGLLWEDAVKSVTINPAIIFGADDELGSIENGKIADLIIWDGDPVEAMSLPLHVIIAGEKIEFVSRQTKLRDRYMDLKSKTPFAYRR